MNCWQILQIAPTSDTKTIRKAYAKLLKTTRPDDDAAAYQNLREAFDEALRLAPYQDEDESPENPPQTDFRQPENPPPTTPHAECAAWIARVQNIIAQDGVVGVLRERQSLSEQIWDTTEIHQRDEAALFWLDFLRGQSHYVPWLWNFGASWFGWWDEDQQLLTEAEFNRLHAKQDDADCVSSPQNVWAHLQNLDENGGDLWAFWQSYPFELAAFSETEREHLGILLHAWRERDDLPDNLRQAWQAQFPEFSASLKSAQIAEIDDKLAHLNALFAKDGVAGVWAVHAETEKWLDDLPPLAKPLIAKQMLDLLRKWQTRSAHLWGHWGRRFAWRDNVWGNTALSDDEREHFYYQHHLIDFYHDIQELADFLNHAYQNLSAEGSAEIGYFWAVYRADMFMLSETELAQLHALMTHYLRDLPHRLPENVFQDWYEITQGESFRQPEMLEKAEMLVPQYDFSGSTEFLPKDVYDFVVKIHEKGGTSAVVQAWDEICVQIQKLPLGHDEAVSHLLLDFLRDKNIHNVQLWAQWGQYFAWHNDYRMSQMLSHDELEMLQRYMDVAAFQSPKFRQPDTNYPLSHGLNDLLQKGKRGKAIWAAFLLQNEWEREVPSEHRQNLFSNNDLIFIDQRVDTLRMLYFAVLITVSFVAVFSSAHLATDLIAMMLMSAVAVGVFFGVYLFLVGSMHNMAPNFTQKYLQFTGGKIGQIVLGIVLPIAMMCGAIWLKHWGATSSVLNNWFDLHAWKIFWLGILGTGLAWNVNLYRMDEIQFSRWWFVQAALWGGFLFALDNSDIKGDTSSQFWGMDVGLMGEPYFVLWAMIVWLNTSVLLKQICDQRGWLNNPVAQTVLFLPAVVLDYANRVSGSQIWQWLCWQVLALGAMSWILPYPQVWLAFYPMLFLLLGLGYTLKNGAKKQILMQEN